MKYFPLVLSGVFRYPGTTALTLISMAIAFLLFGLLEGTASLFDATVQRFGMNRLIVTNRTSGAELQPLAHLSEIERVPGVAAVSFQTLFLSQYRDPRTVVPALAIDPVRFFNVYQEIHLSPAAFAALRATRTGAVIGTQLAKRFGWKVGDHIPLQAMFWPNKDGSRSWTFDIVGLFEAPEGDMHATGMLFNYSYFDEYRASSKGMIGGFIVKPTDPRMAAEVGARIDKQFSNSADRTRTQSENELAYAQLMQIGDIKFVLQAVLVAVLFTLVLLVANTMTQSTATRLAEFGTLRAVGFAGTAVFMLVFAEALVLCESAALLGVGGASLVFLRVTHAILGAHGGKMPPLVPVTAALCAAAIALLTTLGPGLRLAQMRVAEATGMRLAT